MSRYIPEIISLLVAVAMMFAEVPHNNWVALLFFLLAAILFVYHIIADRQPEHQELGLSKISHPQALRDAAKELARQLNVDERLGELERVAGARKITDEQRRILIPKLQKYSEYSVRLDWLSPEGETFSLDLFKLFSDAGWRSQARGPAQRFPVRYLQGLWVLAWEESVARQIASAFREVGFASYAQQSDETFQKQVVILIAYKEA